MGQWSTWSRRWSPQQRSAYGGCAHNPHEIKLVKLPRFLQPVRVRFPAHLMSTSSAKPNGKLVHACVCKRPKWHLQELPPTDLESKWLPPKDLVLGSVQDPGSCKPGPSQSFCEKGCTMLNLAWWQKMQRLLANPTSCNSGKRPNAQWVLIYLLASPVSNLILHDY